MAQAFGISKVLEILSIKPSEIFPTGSSVLDKDKYMLLRDKVVKFKIVPDHRSTVYVQINGVVSRSLTPEGEWYVLELPEGLKAGTYNMEIYIGAKRVVKRVEFKSGMSIQDDDLV